MKRNPKIEAEDNLIEAVSREIAQRLMFEFPPHVGTAAGMNAAAIIIASSTMATKKGVDKKEYVEEMKRHMGMLIDKYAENAADFEELFNGKLN